MTRGTVRSWDDDEGWGVVDSPAVPGGIWTHFSAVRTQGYAALTPGATVDVEWEAADQDGFAHRATTVVPDA